MLVGLDLAVLILVAAEALRLARLGARLGRLQRFITAG